MSWHRKVPFNLSIGDHFAMAFNTSANQIVVPNDDTAFSPDVYEAQAHAACATVGPPVGEMFARWSKSKDYEDVNEARLSFPTYSSLDDTGQAYIDKILKALNGAVNNGLLDLEIPRMCEAKIEEEGIILFVRKKQ